MRTPSDTDRARAQALIECYAASKGLSTDPLPEWMQATARLVAKEAARDGWDEVEPRWRKTLVAFQQQQLAALKADHEVRVRESRRYEIAREHYVRWTDGNGESEDALAMYATRAVQHADALLAALELKS